MESAWLTVGWSLLCGCLAESPKKNVPRKRKKNSWAPGLSTGDRDQSWPRGPAMVSGPALVSISYRQVRGPAVFFFFFSGQTFFGAFGQASTKKASAQPGRPHVVGIRYQMGSVCASGHLEIQGVSFHKHNETTKT